jgi:hypothetical protein
MWHPCAGLILAVEQFFQLFLQIGGSTALFRRFEGILSHTVQRDNGLRRSLIKSVSQRRFWRRVRASLRAVFGRWVMVSRGFSLVPGSS